MGGHVSVHCPQNPTPRLREGGVSQHEFAALPQPAPASRKRKKYSGDEQDRLVVKLPLTVLDIKHVHPST